MAKEQSNKIFGPSHKTWYEFRVYTFISVYSGDLELLVTTTVEFKSHNAKEDADEYVQNIGMNGVSVENPKGVFTYYPPNRIAKIEYNLLPS